ncbi:MAG: hypothetical protein M1829_002624 [Trizodia sp. TS-e1964]|nr:MAG: hypothetical protein M1829_002624 [Trizodia sp. TS-e1964]
MEAVGFALGVASAIGVLGQIFDGCVKAYAFFTTANNLGKDSERLVCKIRIEEMRLMVWGREWGVVEGKLEARLAMANAGNEGLKQMAELILKQLYDTISDFKKLQDRYGLREERVASDGKSEKPEKSAKKADPSVANRLRDELKLRAKWVISDKDKFEVLLKDLKDFNDGLERLFPPASIATLNRTWTNELLQEAKRDMGQLELLESASIGVYHQLNTFASLKQLRINLDAKEGTKFVPSSELKIPRYRLKPAADEGKRIKGEYQKGPNEPSETVIIEWNDYEADADMDTRLVLYQRVDNLARMMHSASNRHPDLHTLDCIGYLEDPPNTRYGLVYRTPASSSSDTITLHSLIQNPDLRTPDLGDRFKLAHTLAIALWSFHSLDWLHKTFCSMNILFFHGTDELAQPFVTGFDSSRPDHIDEMTVASKNESGQDLYRHPDSLGVWRQPYCKAFDVYSLGLVLLEIGIWKNIAQYHKAKKHSAAVFRDKVVMPVLVHGLGSKTGGVYREVVRRCLSCDSKDPDVAGKLLEWVVLMLESLRV